MSVLCPCRAEVTRETHLGQQMRSPAPAAVDRLGRDRPDLPLRPSSPGRCARTRRGHGRLGDDRQGDALAPIAGRRGARVDHPGQPAGRAIGARDVRFGTAGTAFPDGLRPQVGDDHGTSRTRGLVPVLPGRWSRAIRICSWPRWAASRPRCGVCVNSAAGNARCGKPSLGSGRSPRTNAANRGRGNRIRDTPCTPMPEIGSSTRTAKRGRCVMTSSRTHTRR